MIRLQEMTDKEQEHFFKVISLEVSAVEQCLLIQLSGKISKMCVGHLLRCRVCGREGEVLRMDSLSQLLFQGERYAGLCTNASSKSSLCLASPVLYASKWGSKTCCETGGKAVEMV